MCIHNLLGICFFQTWLAQLFINVLYNSVCCVKYISYDTHWSTFGWSSKSIQIHPNPHFPHVWTAFVLAFPFTTTWHPPKPTRSPQPGQNRHPIGIRSPSLSASAWPSPAGPVVPRARQLWWSPAPRHATSYHRCWRSSSTATGLKGDFVELRTEETWKDMIV